MRHWCIYVYVVETLLNLSMLECVAKIACRGSRMYVYSGVLALPDNFHSDFLLMMLVISVCITRSFSLLCLNNFGSMLQLLWQFEAHIVLQSILES